jgi:SAM-dependent MidA family methyltransferase
MDPLTAVIRAEIEATGPIGFARFMDLALYHPNLGYYEGRRPVGQRGDYYTSVGAGGLFGELLAFVFAEWRAGCRNERFQIVEGGAHDGRLARDILEWFHRWGAGAHEVEYWIVEPSPRRQAWQRETLGEWADRVRWAYDWDDRAVGSVQGVIFSNELLDAMPVRRWAWDAAARRWFEWGVGVAEGQFVWVRLEWPTPQREAGGEAGPCRIGDFFPLSAELLAVLPDGFTLETCPAAMTWWRKAAESLAHGRLLTVDYGLTAEEFLSPSRSRGTVRAYRRHRVSDAVLDRPGHQDLTAHVNFSALRAVGEAAGLDTERFETQGRFLVRVVREIERQPERFAPWTTARRRQLATLVHPEHLGRSFWVLAQSREPHS